MLVTWTALGLAPQVRGDAELVNGIQAVVHDSVVTHAEVMEFSATKEQDLARDYRGQFETYQQKVVEARNDSVDKLIQRQLILHDFKTSVSQPERKAMFDKEIKKDVDRRVEEEIHTRFGGNRMSLVKTLQAEGVTMERYRQQISDRIIVSSLRQKNIESETIVSPHRVEAFYLAHRDDFQVQEQVKLRMIVLKCPEETQAAQTEKLGEEILRKLQEGATFAEMATIHSEGSERSEGGDLRWREISDLTKNLADTALSLQPGQHSGVLSRSAGEDYWVCQYEKGVVTAARHYVADKALMKEKLAEERRLGSGSSLTNLPPPSEFYLLMLEDKRPARYKPLVEVREQIEKDLQTQEWKDLEKRWVDKLRKKTFVRVF